MQTPIRLSGYVPGAIGRITEFHARYYHENWDFDLYFESMVAVGLAEFLRRFDPARDGFWLAWWQESMAGGVAIDGHEAADGGARLRWFIVDPAFQGRGIGRRLILEAIRFCRRAGFQRVHLSTFAGLQAARHLYEAIGFRLAQEGYGNHWGKRVLEQTFILDLERGAGTQGGA